MPDPFDKLLPQDQEAERATLGSMLLDALAIDEAERILAGIGAQAFNLDVHQLVYAALVDLHKTNAPLDGVVLKDELERRGQWERIGKFNRLGSLVAAVPSAARVAHYAQLVRDAWLARMLYNEGARIFRSAGERTAPIGQQLRDAETAIRELAERHIVAGIRSMGDLLAEVYAEVDREERRGVETDFTEYDDLTGGLQPRELAMIAARPSMGKTALGIDIARNVALRGLPVLIFSLEMSAHDLLLRMACSRAQVSMVAARRKTLNPLQLSNLRAARQWIEQLPIAIDDTDPLTVGELGARARKDYRERRTALILVDYVQLVRPDRQAERRDLDVGGVAKDLKALAKHLDVPILAIAQLNRGPEQRADKRPTLVDLRESGELEMHADTVALLHRPLKQIDQGGYTSPVLDWNAELRIAKQRNGPLGSVAMSFDGPTMSFRSGHRPDSTTTSEPILAADPGENEKWY